MEGANTIRLREKATDDDAVLKYPAFMKKKMPRHHRKL